MRIGMALALAGCAAPDSGAPAGDHTPVFTAAAIEARTRLLTDVGPRSSGTAGERAGQRAVEEAFAELGLPVERHAFTWSPWLRGTAQITVGDDVFAARALSPSPTTRGLTAPLTLATAGAEPGSLALFRSADGSRSGQFSDALFSGVAGMIRVTDDVGHDDEPLVEVGHTLTGSLLPAVAVDKETGDALSARAGEPATVDIEATTLEGHESVNLVARVPGVTSDRPVYVTAHYDGWDNSEAAIDNALGVGMMLLLAQRLTAGPTPARDVVFLATAGEEQGLNGAFRYVADVPEAATARFVLNLDIPWAHEGRYIVATTDTALQQLALDVAASLGLDPVDGGDPSPASDHLPFQAEGVPAAWHTRWPDRHYHTTQDTVEQLDFEEAIPALEVNWSVLQAVAFDD